MTRCPVGRRWSRPWATPVVWLALLVGPANGQEKIPPAVPTDELHAPAQMARPGPPPPSSALVLPAPQPPPALGPPPPDPTGEHLLPKSILPIPIGATGPGLNYLESYPCLNGAFVPETGWPMVLLDHFAPRLDRVANLWVVQESHCPQQMGSDFWQSVKVLHFDASGRLVPCDPQALLAQVAGRPVLILVQGNLNTPDIALGGLLWTHSWLQRHHSLPPDAVVISYDWASARTSKRSFIDINEKGRRAFVGGYHLACFLQAFPPGSQVCLLGQSFGARVVLAALHLMAGGPCSDRIHGGTPVRLPGPQVSLHLRAVIVEAAIDHNWILIGKRLGCALEACEAFLNLYNSRSSVVRLYPLLWNGEHHRSLALVGLSPADQGQLGPYSDRYRQRDVTDLIGKEHTLLRLLAHPEGAHCIAPYTGAVPLPPPSSP